MAPVRERPVTPTLSLATTVNVTDWDVLSVVSSKLVTLLEYDVILGSWSSLLLILIVTESVEVLLLTSVAVIEITSSWLPNVYEA